MEYLNLQTFVKTNVCSGCPYTYNEEDCKKSACHAQLGAVQEALRMADYYKMHTNDVPDTTREVLLTLEGKEPGFLPMQRIARYMVPSNGHEREWIINGMGINEYPHMMVGMPYGWYRVKGWREI